MTALYGVITFLVVLGPLVILHELGHLFAARLMKVKVIEFGFGFPPRAFGLWTGRTRVRLDHDASFDEGMSREDLRVGRQVALVTAKDQAGQLVVRHVARNQARPKGATGLISGKLRAIEGDDLVISEMVWSFNWLPLGGFVKMVGEEDPSSEGSLAGKSRLARAFVLVSGAAINAIIPFVLFAAIFMVPQEQVSGRVVITSVFPGSPADGAGLRQGDLIRKVDGRDIDSLADLQQAVTLRLGAVSHWDVQRGIPDPAPEPGGPRFQYRGGTDQISVVPRWKPPSRAVVREVANEGSEIALWKARQSDPFIGISDRLVVVERATDTVTQISLLNAQALDARLAVGATLKVVRTVTDPLTQISIEDARRHDASLGTSTRLQEGAVGITISMTEPTRESIAMNPFAAIAASVRQVGDVLVLTKNGITGIFVGSSNPQLEGPATVGPVGIGQLTGEIATSGADGKAKVLTLVSLAATLSLSLAILNILPIPALDGGRLLFVVIEWVRGGRRISPEREGLVHLAGMIMILMLVTLISVQDVLRIFRGERFF
ncbi:MAG: PDZ domain-containing protein [SAR202 cluster bacterium]|nr:PDZ domain-containing protein [SAR202 cluster bacterium]